MDISMNSFDGQTILVLLVVVLLTSMIKLLFYNQNKIELPPGPVGYPIIGHLPMLKPTMHKACIKLAEKYGDVFRIRLGSWPAIVVNGKEAIREALTKKFDDFAGRPPVFSSTVISKGKSVAFSSEFSSAWKLQRKIFRNSLHRFADIKSELLHDILIKEGDILVNQFFDKNGQPFNPGKYILESVGSVIYQICYGQKSNVREDEIFRERLFRQQEVLDFVRAGNPLDMIPWLRYVLPWEAKRYCRLVRANTHTRHQMIEKHTETFNEENIRDFTDSLIQASAEYNDEQKMAAGLTNDHIFSNLEGLEGAGFETVANTLRWALLYLAKYPEKQEKVRQEIIAIIGDKVPQISDKAQLPYTEATILEILRFSSIVPMAIPHYATKDGTLMGYNVPKGTMILVNLFSIAFDEQFWEDPDCFRPERFLNNNGDLDLEKANYFLPFGCGRRRCLGERVARAEIFLLLTIILQNCRIIKPPGTELELEGVVSLVVPPKPHEIIIESLI